MNETAFIAVGSNIDPEVNVPSALRLLLDAARVVGCSTFYRTPPLGRADQPSFVNGVWRIETELDPEPLKFDLLRGIERRLGRMRTDDKYAPRTIDLDVVLFGRRAVDQARLGIPAGDLTRPFVLLCVRELAPDWPLPDGRTVGELSAEPGAENMIELPALTKTLRETLSS